MVGVPPTTSVVPFGGRRHRGSLKVHFLVHVQHLAAGHGQIGALLVEHEVDEHAVLAGRRTQDVTPSQVVRRLIRDYLRQHGMQWTPGDGDDSGSGYAPLE